jgi:serine/threonine-protein kinase
MTRERAEETLKNNRLGARYAGEQESDERAGTVASQTPRAGEKVKPRTVVQFRLAKPFTEIVVPNVIGLHRDQAERILKDSKFTTRHTGERESDRPAGTVVDQMPPAGASDRPGAVVQFWLAKPFAMVRVPEVKGMTRQEAESALASTRLQPEHAGEKESDAPAGNVVDQTPSAGETVKPGTTVKFWLAKSVMLVPVPDLVGMSHDDPADIPALLQKTGLQLGAVALRDSDQPVETILEQDPAAGTLVERGARVNLIVARAPAAGGNLWPTTAGGALLIVGAAVVLASATLMLRKSALSRESASSGAARVTARKDTGRQEILSEASPAINLDIRLRGRLDKGSQTLEMSPASGRGGNENG